MPPMPEVQTFSWFTRHRFAWWMGYSQGLDEYTATTWWYTFFQHAKPGYWRYVDGSGPEDYDIELWLVVIPQAKPYV